MPSSVTPTQRSDRRRHRAFALVTVLALAAGGLALDASGAGAAEAWSAWHAATVAEPEAAEDEVEADGHLVISEVLAGGVADASDEFIEIYNPTANVLPLEGLELIYVSASGATLTRKGEWSAGAASVPPGGHVLLANDAGAYAPMADMTYVNGLAATGGSVAIRIREATTAIDAVGWGTSASTWLEGAPAPAVSGGHSLERLPGGAAGSGQDTDDNAADFADRAAPDPQNAAAPPIPISPTAAPSQSLTPTPMPTQSLAPTPAPSLTTTPTPTPAPSLTPVPSPTPGAVTVAAARLLPDGTVATIEGVSLTSSTFTDGGGYVADPTGGIAVIVSGGTFARGQLLRITGEVDDRFHQRTLRVDAGGLSVIGDMAEPEPITSGTGTIDEAVEGQLVAITATVASAATELSGSVAFDIDDGSGLARLVVLDAAGIDHSAWVRGTSLQLRGVVGQRDSSGTGTTGYRVQPRDPGDLIAVTPPSPTPTPGPSGGGSASPTPSGEPGLVSIATARETALNSRVRIRGVVTLSSSVLADGTAAIQDATGAIILRLGDGAGTLSQGEILVVDGRRSTKSGMETVLVSVTPDRRGRQAQPDASRHATGELGEAQEALLVKVRGEVATTPRRTSAQNVYFDLDDGSGPLRVYVSPRTGIDVTGVALGSTLEVTGVLGQETSGQQPEGGYRLWPRAPGDVKVVAAPGNPTAGPGVPGSGAGPSAPGAPGPVGVPGAGAPPRAIDLAVPRLGASRLPRSEPTPSPHAGAAAAVEPAASESIAEMAPWLALAAAVLAAAGAVAAARPGLLGRLRLAVARPAHEVDGAGPVPEPESGPAAPGDASPLERAVARLVPLTVVDDVASSDPVPLAASRSESRRILPPT